MLGEEGAKKGKREGGREGWEVVPCSRSSPGHDVAACVFCGEGNGMSECWFLFHVHSFIALEHFGKERTSKRGRESRTPLIPPSSP